jgi:hypothetical protein
MNIKYQSSYDWLEKRVAQGSGGGVENIISRIKEVGGMNSRRS